jgi:hypothetical protein
MNKRLKRKKTNRNNISYGKIYQKTRDYDLESKTIKEKRNPDK